MSKFEKALNTARQSEEYWFERVKLGVASQLQDLVRAAKLTQERYAEKLGIKPPQVSRTLSGASNPTLETLVKMGLALGCVPKVTFVPIQGKASVVSTAVEDAGATLTLDIELIFAAQSLVSHRPSYVPSYAQMVTPQAEWTKTNDDYFCLAA